MFRFLQLRYFKEYGLFTQFNIIVNEVAELIQDGGSNDCGAYMLHYAETILSSSPLTLIQCFSVEEHKEKLSTKREVIKNTIMSQLVSRQNAMRVNLQESNDSNHQVSHVANWNSTPNKSKTKKQSNSGHTELAKSRKSTRQHKLVVPQSTGRRSKRLKAVEKKNYSESSVSEEEDNNESKVGTNENN